MVQFELIKKVFIKYCPPLFGWSSEREQSSFNRLTQPRCAGRRSAGPRPPLRKGGPENLIWSWIPAGWAGRQDGIMFEMAKQSRRAVDEAMVLFLVDGRAGCTPQDAIIAEQLRKITNRSCCWSTTEACSAQVAPILRRTGNRCRSSAHGDNVTSGRDRAGNSAGGGRNLGKTAEDRRIAAPTSVSPRW
jgi:hypothetical protein